MKYFGRTIFKTALVIAVLAGLAAYAYFGEFKRGKSANEAKEAAKQLVTIPKDTITGIDLEQAGMPQISLQKTGDAWTIASPVKSAADRQAADALAQAFSSIRAERTVDDKPASLAAYGLDKPTIRAVVTTSSGKPVTIFLGMENAFDRTSYIMRDGDPKVYQVSSGVKTQIGKDLFALRDKRLFTFDKNDNVGSVEVALPSGAFSAVRDGAVWNVTLASGKKVERFRGDEEEIQKILNAMRSARALSVEAESGADQSKYGFGKSFAGIKDSTAGEEKILLLQEAGRVFARKSSGGPVYAVSEQFVKDMTKTAFELRFKKLLDFKRDDVKKISIKGPDGEFAISKSGSVADQWDFDGASEKAKPYKLSSLLYALGSLKAAEITGDSRSPVMLQTNPERSIVLIDGNGKEIGRLEILGPGENGYRVQGSALPAQAIVERSKIDDISFKKADYSDAPPAPAPPGPAQ